jgi:hypothetical protein
MKLLAGLGPLARRGPVRAHCLPGLWAGPGHPPPLTCATLPLRPNGNPWGLARAVLLSEKPPARAPSRSPKRIDDGIHAEPRHAGLRPRQQDESSCLPRPRSGPLRPGSSLAAKLEPLPPRPWRPPRRRRRLDAQTARSAAAEDRPSTARDAAQAATMVVESVPNKPGAATRRPSSIASSTPTRASHHRRRIPPRARDGDPPPAATTRPFGRRLRPAAVRGRGVEGEWGAAWLWFARAAPLGAARTSPSFRTVACHRLKLMYVVFLAYL